MLFTDIKHHHIHYIKNCIITNIEYIKSINKMDGNACKNNTKVYIKNSKPLMYLGELPSIYINKSVNIKYESIKLYNTHYWIDTIDII
jgi:hypothetical protein